jgi:hypothetical protein
MRECRRSEAEAIDGNSDSASVFGDNGFAQAGISGNDDVATVFDPAATSSSAGSNAYAILGNDNFASVFGDGDYDRAGGTGGFLGSNDIATIFVTDSTALAGWSVRVGLGQPVRKRPPHLQGVPARPQRQRTN